MTETPTTRGPDDPDPAEVVIDDPAEGTEPDPKIEDDHGQDGEPEPVL